MAPTSRGLDCPKYHHLVEKKKTKSPIWEHFKLPADEKGQLVTNDIAICMICNFPVSCKGGSTTNLSSHLKVYHPLNYSQIYNGNKHAQVQGTSTLKANVTEEDAPLTVTGNKAVITVVEDEIPIAKRQKTMLDF